MVKEGSQMHHSDLNESDAVAADANPSDSSTGPFFKDIAGDDAPDITEMESLCMNCHENGTTRLLLTKIPFFKEIVIMAFECPHCGYRSSEAQSGGVIQPKGVCVTLNVTNKNDLNREVVKSDSASVSIPEVDFEIPSNTQKGVLSTIEGILSKTIDGLQADQAQRLIETPEVAMSIAAFIRRLEAFRDGDEPFTFIVDDPSGNSFVENPFAPKADPAMKIKSYERSREQDEALGLAPPSDEAEAVDESLIGRDEVMGIPSNCPNCHSPCMMHMKIVDIPHFKEVIIMAMNCDSCGAKTNEIKSGGAIAEKGKIITFHCTESDDMNRDLLKSETAAIKIPELQFESTPGTLGGRFTTIEGILTQVKEQLEESNPFVLGDSSQKNHAGESLGAEMRNFLNELDSIIDGKKSFHLVIDDPAGNSYLQNPYAPDADPNMVIEEYERTFEQNEELGLNDMNTDNYKEGDTKQGKDLEDNVASNTSS